MPRRINSLPVVEYSELICSTRRQMRNQAAMPGVRTITRYVEGWRANIGPVDDLLEHLTQTDQEFRNLAEVSPRIAIPDHEWCLIPKENAPTYLYYGDKYDTNGLARHIPAGFVLGVSVEAVRGEAAVHKEDIVELGKVVDSYNHKPEPLKLADVGIRQFLADHQEDTGTLYTYTDLEPKLTGPIHTRLYR